MVGFKFKDKKSYALEIGSWDIFAIWSALLFVLCEYHMSRSGMNVAPPPPAVHPIAISLTIGLIAMIVTTVAKNYANVADAVVSSGLSLPTWYFAFANYFCN